MKARNLKSFLKMCKDLKKYRNMNFPLLNFPKAFKQPSEKIILRYLVMSKIRQYFVQLIN